MNIYLGNLTVGQITERLEITLTDEEILIMNKSNQESAQNIAPDKWHCFDIPFTIACGSMDMAIKIRDLLSPYSEKMKQPLQISINR